MRSSSEWVHYFRGNVHVTLMTIPWESGYRLSTVERRVLCGSLRGFQAGESSDGRRLLHYGQRYAERTGDVDYVEALRLFVAEEQRHADDEDQDVHGVGGILSEVRARAAGYEPHSCRMSFTVGPSVSSQSAGLAPTGSRSRVVIPTSR